MTAIGMILIALGYVVTVGLMGWLIARQENRICELEARVDNHEDELLAIDPGWLP